MLEYWFMLPIAIIIATIAMILGVGGALFFSPIFILLFPLVGVTVLSPADAFGAALLTEVFGFSSGLIGYARKKLIDRKTALMFIMVGIPGAVIGTLFKRVVPDRLIILIFGIGLLVMAYYVYINTKVHNDNEIEGAKRSFTDADGELHEYLVCNQTQGRIITFFGALFTGLLSVGIGETTTPTLRIRCRVPTKIASATSVLVVTVVIFASSITDILLVGVESVPWGLVLFTIPGVLLGGQLGPKLANKFSSETTERLLIISFVVIGILMIIRAIGL